MDTAGNTQQALGLEAFWPRKPINAPEKLVRQIDSEAQAVAVAIKASGQKLASIAHAMGKSESYLSRIRSGQRPVPEKFIKPFCRAVGNRLLEQYVEMIHALHPTSADRIAALAAILTDLAA
ncbi:hypothetical protein [Dyella caseinilytica]|uniref:XRE family transcriptional regulator n=1 Tax=Dyella caseinilytica TaxID=1849581 RepID=A0ABX7GPY6_9GAMM|nr:hypothetical protein [Dyella caseinilytica]QRN52416.1 hypothetical protein ISN74_13115 [Dyella caseinilytica]GGA05787.1 hypothetical protein GCM10011408_28420 [Dyella caseinilytica]